MYPADYKYTETHEWIAVTGDTGRVGITDYAQEHIGELVFVGLPEVGRVLKAGESFGAIDSSKSASDLYSPVSGEVIAVNAGLADKPEQVNGDPHGCWMIEVRLSDPTELDALLDASRYVELIKHID
jgi:glycine cleavage system H protein